MLRDSRRNKKTAIWYVLFSIIVIANIVAKIWYVPDLSIWYDESISIITAERSIFKVFEHASLDNTPPTFDLLMFFWTRIFGVSEIAIRLPSVIFTALCAGFIFHYGQKKKNYAVGLIGAAIYSLSNYNTWYAQEARCYALVSMLSVLALIAFDNWLTEPDNKKRKRHLIIINFLLLFTHYLTAFFIAAQGLYVLLKSKGNFKTYWKISLRVLLFFAPWSIFMVKNLINISDGFWIPPTTPEAMGTFLYDFFGTNPMMITVGAVIVIGIVFVILRRDSSHGLPMLLLFTFLPLLLLIGLSEFVPLFIPRYIIYIFPFLSITIALSVSQLTDNMFIHFALGAVYFGQQIPLIDLKQEKVQNVRGMVEDIKAREEKDRIIILQTELSYAMFSYHYDREKYFVHPYKVKELMKKDDILSFSRLNQMDTTKTDNAKQVIIVNIFDKSADPEQKVRARLLKHHPNITFNKDYGRGLLMSVYEK